MGFHKAISLSGTVKSSLRHRALMIYLVSSLLNGSGCYLSRM